MAKTLEALVIGESSGAALAATNPPELRGRIFAALYFYEFHGLPPCVPPEQRGLFWAILKESRTIRRKPCPDFWEIPFSDSTGANPANCANGAIRAIRANGAIRAIPAEEKRIEENRIENNPMSNETRACVREETPASVSSSESSVDILKLLSSGQPWEGDPVEAALLLTGETSGLARGSFGKMLRAVGRKEFLDVLHWFAADIASGEAVRNRGAALTDNLKARAGLLGIKL